MTGKMNDPSYSLLAERNQAYQERNRVIAVMAKLAQNQGMKTWLFVDHSEQIEAEWRFIVYLELPTGQVSWHIHESELSWFSFLPKVDQLSSAFPHWDGHNTEEKYLRCQSYCNTPRPIL